MAGRMSPRFRVLALLVIVVLGLVVPLFIPAKTPPSRGDCVRTYAGRCDATLP